MATIQILPASHTSPAEYRNTKAANCVECGAEWDEEDDLDTWVDTLEGSFYCMVAPLGNRSCLAIARARIYRERVAQLVKDKIAEAIAEIKYLDREFHQPPSETPDHPALILEDLDGRMDAFSKGVDSGWRNGLMLDDIEARRLARVLDQDIHTRSFSLRWDLGLHPDQTELRIGEYTAGSRASDLARIAVAHMDLTAFLARTERRA